MLLTIKCDYIKIRLYDKDTNFNIHTCVHVIQVIFSCTENKAN